MKKAVRFLAVAASLALLGGAAFSQDDFDFSSTDDSSESSFDDFSDSSTPAITISGKAEVKARGYYKRGSTKTSGYSTDKYSLDRTPINYYDSFDDFQKMPVTTAPSAKLDIGYSGLSTDLDLKLKLDNNSLGDYKEDILDEFTARAYLGNFQIEAGKMRVVWGKGDKLHVLDNFNANDYTDYIIPDYIDRRISEPMFRIQYSTLSNIRFEGIYTPWMTADRLAEDGVWQPYQRSYLTSNIKNLGASQVVAAGMTAGARNTAYATALASDPTEANPATLAAKNAAAQAQAAYIMAMSQSSSLSDDIYPDTKKLKYGQAGLRTTFTLGHLDLGLSYYYGHYKQPTVNKYQVSKFVTSYMAGTTLKDTGINYDQLQVFGLEGAAVIGMLNTRFEAAYNLTNDFKGDNPYIKNNSISWVGGFDVDLPIHNVNINIQEQGSYIINHKKIHEMHGRSYLDEIKAGDEDFAFWTGDTTMTDVEYDKDNIYTNNKIVVDLTDTFNHEKIKVDLKGIYGIERRDLLVIPELSIRAVDDFTISINSLFIHNFWKIDKKYRSEFYGWLDNDFVQISCKYQF